MAVVVVKQKYLEAFRDAQHRQRHRRYVFSGPVQFSLTAIDQIREQLVTANPSATVPPQE
jgi:hypothetical protein